MAGVDEATSRGEFCRAVSLALDSWVNEAGPSSLKRLPESLRSEFEALRAHTQGILYGASDAEQTRPPEPAEITQATTVLQSLRRLLS